MQAEGVPSAHRAGRTRKHMAEDPPARVAVPTSGKLCVFTGLAKPLGCSSPLESVCITEHPHVLHSDRKCSLSGWSHLGPGLPPALHTCPDLGGCPTSASPQLEAWEQPRVPCCHTHTTQFHRGSC